MELNQQPLCFASFTKANNEYRARICKASDATASSSISMKPQQSRNASFVRSGLPETAASVAIAATVVGVASTLLVRRTRASDVSGKKIQIPSKVCEDCGGSGICSKCNGEGFVLKRIVDEGAEQARLSADNFGTRYTSGLPKKWSYCTKCSSSRSCSTCNGLGKLEL